MYVMSLETITQKIQDKLTTAPSVNAKIKLDFGLDGVVFVDATQATPTVNNEDQDADTVLQCDIETFKDIVSGTQDPTLAYMTGKLKILGNMGIAMKLNSLLED